MKINFSELAKMQRGVPYPEVVNAFARDVAGKIVAANGSAPDTVFKMRRGVCQSVQYEIQFNSVVDALLMAESKRWFGELRVQKGKTVFVMNTINDQVDFDNKKETK